MGISRVASLQLNSSVKSYAGILLENCSLLTLLRVYSHSEDYVNIHFNLMTSICVCWHSPLLQIPILLLIMKLRVISTPSLDLCFIPKAFKLQIQTIIFFVTQLFGLFIAFKNKLSLFKLRNQYRPVELNIYAASVSILL